MKKHIYKGQVGYLNAQKKKEVIRTISFFAISLMVYGLGFWSTGTNKNLLSIVAILGMLPASKSAVTMIMYLKTKSTPEEVFQTITPYVGNLLAIYEMVFTSYDNTFPIDCIVLDDNHLIGYTSRENGNMNAAEKHLSTMLSQNGFVQYNVKIFNDYHKFINRLQQLNQKIGRAHV